MPLSVTERRAAVRQFVAEQHGRPEDKRLDGPQVRKKTPEAILMSPYNDDAALRRQAALTRVRQRAKELCQNCTCSDDARGESSPSSRSSSYQRCRPAAARVRGASSLGGCLGAAAQTGDASNARSSAKQAARSRSLGCVTFKPGGR
eukprot:symbB.v1.2.037484.t1/scaffold5552.1/size25952/3